uniref:Phosphoribosyltransferase domain-containing protein n=1 Tax=Leptocylindrus danicus TaxID=163516 RepID=A0A7S2PCB1_9STRA|mmetsp:Transcript_29235/g.42925  ORF Transcript_29235/g.42925 Transcript_29235/m.42925 type:complete len:287 (+) Transcript_29235:639-1499(+)|eukprot:CAMPEP_0116027842 /NCGR_PEP_ID=MMETSP0321-20121206/14953_1 /TAXON_ID=163516 /ORGANISM="Leptocylindrus danicus var. danicus, Strain B650" /LENGTH=286 /DNA_ID=CAMNT_0003501441 /DNA_START=551 /DNA_END=1411 /DNA_ORIENTATION=-
MPPNPNKNNVVDALESLNINELVETIETVPDKEPTKDEGNIFYSYDDVHTAAIAASQKAQLRGVSTPDAIIALGTSGSIPATILQTELINDTTTKIPILSVDVDDKGSITQWFDASIGHGQKVNGGSVLLVDLLHLDGDNVRLSRCVEKLQQRHQPCKITVVVAFGAVETPSSYIVGSTIPSNNNCEVNQYCFPWDAKSTQCNLVEHNKKSDRCASIAAFKKKREAKMKERADRWSAMEKLQATENPPLSSVESSLPAGSSGDIFSADAITKHLVDDAGAVAITPK